MNSKNAFGKLGEESAKAHLLKLGYEIIAVNWRVGHLEIDIIAKEAQEMVFVEVKTRNSSQFGNPELSVSKRKQNKLALAAEQFIHKFQFEGNCRYDIIAIVLNKSEKRILHIKDAFYPGVY